MKLVWQKAREWVKDNRFGLLILLLAWLIFFSPIISGRSVYFLDDLKIIYYPLEQLYAQAQHEWRLPVWSNEFGFGQPVMAWGQLGFFTPLHVLLRALFIPPLYLLQISVVLYFGLGLLGMYVLLRRFVSWEAAALGSAVYVFSGFNIGHLNHVNFYTTTMLLPWLLLALYSFVVRPRAHTTAIVSTLGAAMALSGQPQVTLYSFGIAATFAAAIFFGQWRQRGGGIYAIRLIGFGILSSIVAVALASFALLPLSEFLPQTERVSGLPDIELFEFSYPPFHAITLLLPYFFGDHQHYWGAKGFQELAAFLGIIPLVLGSLALSWWRKNNALRATGVVLLLVSAALALGRNSIVYSWLVQEKWLTSLSVPGRFVFFFDVAFALLAAQGLDDLFRLGKLSSRGRIVVRLLTFILPVVLLAGFFFHVQSDVRVYHQFMAIVSSWQLDWALAVIGAILFIAVLLITSRLSPGGRVAAYLRLGLVVVTVGTLLALAWNYNPREPRSLAVQAPPFADALRRYGEGGLPPRLYSAENILWSEPPVYGVLPTDHISPKFTVHQRIVIQKPGLSCLAIPIMVNEQYHGLLRVLLREGLSDDPIASYFFSPTELSASEPLHICSPWLAGRAGQAFFLSFESQGESPIQLLYTTYHQAEEPVYFVRVKGPTAEQLAASRKNARIIFTPTYEPNTDLEVSLLHRHLNVLVPASSARWIGALSIGTYREFIEHFFANDREPIDGDGLHAIVRFRNILNMAGVTHLIQTLPHGADDGLAAAGYTLLQTHDLGPRQVRLYQNPQALPKAFLVHSAVFKPAADETRYALQYEPYSAQEIVYIDGPTPPEATVQAQEGGSVGTAKIINYTPTRVDVEVDVPEQVFLVVSDSTTTQWQTFIDDEAAPQYRANSIFKAAQVPAGRHTVSFRYYSPAIAWSKKLTGLGIIVVLILLTAAPLHSYGVSNRVSSS